MEAAGHIYANNVDNSDSNYDSSTTYNRPSNTRLFGNPESPQLASVTRDELADAEHAEPVPNALESDDEMEWEEVDVLQDDPKDSGLPTQNVEVILEKPTKKPKKRVGGDPVQRKLRLETHKTHTVALLASFSLRNKWLNDSLLHARLLSLTPLPLQISFSMIHKKTEPDASRRTRLFQTACFKLAEWWHNSFHIVKDKGMRSRTFLEAEKQRTRGEKQMKANLKGKGKAGTTNDGEAPWSDRTRSAKSLMKHALLHEGSADTSALLFTALCRALDIPARLVVSLQSVPWSSKSEVLKPSADNPSLSFDDKEVEPAVQKQRSRPKDRKSRVTLPRSLSTEPPLEGWPPVVWTEVFSRPESRWIPIDPIRYLVDKKKLFEPPADCRINRMMYVVAFEEDGYARDVTLRYAKEFAAKTAKARALTKRGQSEWWQRIISILTRPYRLHRDDIEDGELQSLQYIEGMPMSMNGFKDHPIYALERHLRRDEIIHPMKEIGKFRGEPVYSRSSVQRVRTAETWMREGKVVREGQQPLKRVTQRAHTINRKRILELAKAESPAEIPTLGAYAEWQTELYVPEPVVAGRIPKNDFGNINLFVPSMLPAGATHLPFQSIAKVAKELGVDFAPAVTGFEFRKGHANPILSGIVVAAESEELIVSAYWESVQANQEAEQLKKRARVLRRWSKLILGLQLRKRLQEEYGSSENKVDEAEAPQEMPPEGGFLTEYDGVIEHFDLPKTRIIHYSNGDAAPQEVDDAPPLPYDPHGKWSPEPHAEIVASDSRASSEALPTVMPKTLREHAALQWAGREHSTTTASSPRSRPTRNVGKARRSHLSSDEDDSYPGDPSPKRTRSSRTRTPTASRQLRSSVRIKKR